MKPKADHSGEDTTCEQQGEISHRNRKLQRTNLVRPRKCLVVVLERRNERYVGEVLWIVVGVTSGDVIEEVLQSRRPDRFITAGGKTYQIRQGRAPAKAKLEQELRWERMIISAQ